MFGLTGDCCKQAVRAAVPSRWKESRQGTHVLGALPSSTTLAAIAAAAAACACSLLLEPAALCRATRILLSLRLGPQPEVWDMRNMHTPTHMQIDMPEQQHHKRAAPCHFAHVWGPRQRLQAPG